MSSIFIYLIKGYQKALSPETGAIPSFLGLNKKICVFYPSCSTYAISAIEKYGSGKGLMMATQRIFRCHPWQEPSIDYVK